MSSPDTSAQDAPVASQEAEAREWEIAEAEFQRGYVAGRVSEREMYAELFSGICVVCDSGWTREGHTRDCVVGTLAALEEAESA